MGPLSPGYGIDLGTANTVVFKPGQGVVLDEPSYMLTRGGARSAPVLVGQEARDLTGRTSQRMTTVRPLQDGVITDLEIARAFIKAVIARAPRRFWEVGRPQAVIGIPGGATAIERRTLVEAVEEAGIARVDLIPEPVAGAIGCGIDPLEARAHLVVDVGGGTAEVTAFCFGDVLVNRSVRIAGDEMTAALHIWLRQHKGIMVGELTAEEVKVRLREAAAAGRADLAELQAVEPVAGNGHAAETAPEAGGAVAEAVAVAVQPRPRRTNGRRHSPLVVHGRSVTTGRPKSVWLDPDEVSDALKPTVEAIVEVLQTCLEDLPPQTVSDIMEDGILAFGGGSMLHGFGRRLEQAFGFKVHLADRPLTCVAEGAAICLARPSIIRAFDVS